MAILRIKRTDSGDRRTVKRTETQPDPVERYEKRSPGRAPSKRGRRAPDSSVRRHMPRKIDHGSRRAGTAASKSTEARSGWHTNPDGAAGDTMLVRVSSGPETVPQSFNLSAAERAWALELRRRKRQGAKMRRRRHGASGNGGK